MGFFLYQYPECFMGYKKERIVVADRENMKEDRCNCINLETGEVLMDTADRCRCYMIPEWVRNPLLRNIRLTKWKAENQDKIEEYERKKHANHRKQKRGHLPKAEAAKKHGRGQ